MAVGVPSEEAAAFLLDHLRAAPDAAKDAERFVEHVARYGADGSQAAVRSVGREAAAGDPRRELVVLRAIHRGVQARGGRLDEGSRAWAVELARGLFESDRDRDVLAAIDLAGTIRLEALAGPLDALLASDEAAADRRLAAIDARAALDPSGAVAPIAGLLASSDEPPPIRDRAAEALGRLGRPEADAHLLEALAIAPSRLQRTIAVALSGTRAGAEALLATVEAGRASADLLREPPVQIRMTGAGVESMAARIEALTAGLPPADEATRRLIDERLDRFASLAADADAEAGRAVFAEHCASCHRVGGEGAEVGPQLDGVGVRGPLRLMEDVLDPNRNVDQAFRSTTLALADGRVLSGLLLAEEGDALVLADAEGKALRIPAAEVEERVATPLSPMPANFGERIPEDEFHRLIAFLLAQRAGDE